MLIALATVWFYFGYGAVLHALEQGDPSAGRLVEAFFLDSLVGMVFLLPFAGLAMAGIALALYFLVNRRPRTPPPEPPLPPLGGQP